jgi:D-alanine transaminase
MTEWIWLNGRTIPFCEAHLSVEDRGFQFADGVYEVIKLYAGRPFALDEHLARLERSAAGIELQPPLTRAELTRQIKQFITHASAGEGMIYLQLTRGASPRNHLFPHLTGGGKINPTLLFYFRALPVLPAVGEAPGVKLATAPDDRWQRCWIKSIALLPNVLAKNAAVAAGADEAVYLDHGAGNAAGNAVGNAVVTECSASNIFAVIGGKLVTHPVGRKVLPGITRQVLLQLAPGLKLEVQERPWTEAEALAADELFILSTTRELSWVAQWNDKPVRPGQAGPITNRLHAALKDYVGRDISR